MRIDRITPFMPAIHAQVHDMKNRNKAPAAPRMSARQVINDF